MLKRNFINIRKLLCLSLMVIALILPSAHSKLAYYLIGGVTDTSVNIKAKAESDSSSSSSSSTSTITYEMQVSVNGTAFSTYQSDVYGYFDISISGLKSESYYAIDLNLNNVNVAALPVKTFPSSNQNTPFSFIASSYLKSGSDFNVMLKIANYTQTPNFFFLLGNMFSDDGSSTWQDYEQKYLNGKISISILRDLIQNLLIINLN